jgi:hypothetical protein
MISNILQNKVPNTLSPPKIQNLTTKSSVPVKFDFCASSLSDQMDACTGKIESISNAASPTSEVCVDQSVDSIAQRQL